VPTNRFLNGLGLPILLALSCLGGGCEKGYQQGDCDPGWLDVDGTCTLAVGQDCTRNDDCLSGICANLPEEGQFCTIRCDLHEDCPTGFYCDMGQSGLCYPGKRPPACKSDEDCQPCEECRQGFCLDITGCVRCENDSGCIACQRCDQGICVNVTGCTRCLEDLNCPPCEECSERGECQRRIGCILCATAQDCPGCMTCVLGACEPIPGCGTDPCFNDADCPENTQCLLDSQLGISVCLPVGLPFGADCHRGGDPTCAEGVCVQNDDGSFTCSRECQSGDEECPDTLECLPDEDCLFACRTPVSRPPGNDCRSDADCPAGRVCGLLANSDNTAWRPRCIEPWVCAGQPGAACDPGAESGDRCTTGFCSLPGYCTSLCASDFDCPGDFLCDQLEHPLPGGEAAAYFGCAPREMVPGEAGEPCPQGDADCRSGVCLAEPAAGAHPYCSLDCTPGHAECPDRFACRPSPVDAQHNLCQPSVIGGDCARDSDCPSEQVCTVDPAGSTACIVPLPGGVGPGQPCSNGICRNDLCLRFGVCGALCVSPADCPDGFLCDYLEIYLFGGSRAFTRMCVPDPGSMLTCQHDAHCQSEESCSLVLNPWGSGLEGRCQPNGPGGDTGNPCTQPGDCRTGFCPTSGSCTVLCLDTQDCPTGYECQADWVSLWEGTAFPVRACLASTTEPKKP